jgi:DNA repair exonuclease SbcCD ATPase subunit
MNIRFAAGVAVALLAFTAPVSAQTQRQGSADARVMQQMQQMTAERAQLQAENAKLKEDLEQARKDLSKATADKGALEHKVRAGAANANRDEVAAQQAQAELERVRTQMQELVTKFRETAQNLREVEGGRATAQSQLKTQERELKTCIDRNAGLYNLNAEVLDRMSSRGFWSAVGEREPFTKVKRVQLENLIEDYKYRADELRLEQQQAQTKAAADTGR